MAAVLTKIKESPILFSDPMVRAIIEGNKWVTRRIPVNKTELKILDEPYSHYIRNRRGTWDSYKTLAELVEKHSPYGKPGDIIWVREAWRPRSWGKDFDWMCLEYRANENTDRARFKKDVDPMDMWHTELRLIAAWEKLSDECRAAGCDFAGDMFTLKGKDGQRPIKWRPSIFMPRAACRLRLRITDVRVERLQDISEAQAIAEGVEEFSFGKAGLNFDLGGSQQTRDPLQAFKWLWDNINAKRGYGWELNPWVWVIEFDRIPENG